MLRSLSPLSRQTSITPSINDRWAIVSSAHTYRIYFCSHLRQEKLYCYDNMECHLYQLNEKDTPFKKSFLTLLSTKVYKPCMINGFFLYFFFISQRIVSIHGLVSAYVQLLSNKIYNKRLDTTKYARGSYILAVVCDNDCNRKIKISYEFLIQSIEWKGRGGGEW